MIALKINENLAKLPVIINKRSPTKGRRHLYMESSTGTFHRDCVLVSFCECRRHYSSWEVSHKSQSSPPTVLYKAHKAMGHVP